MGYERYGQMGMRQACRRGTPARVTGRGISETERMGNRQALGLPGRLWRLADQTARIHNSRLGG